MPLPPVTGWVVDGLRLTVFTAEPLSLQSAGHFHALAGVPPENAVTKHQAAEYIESGPFEVGQLELKGVLNRLDWTYSAVPAPGPFAPNLGSFVEQLHGFVERFGAWLTNADLNPIRVALGASIFHRTENRTGNNALIRELAPFITYDPSRVSDVAMQFNFQIPSTVNSDVLLNRLTRLISMQVRMFNYGVGSTLAEVEHAMCRVELDFNTAEASGAVVQQVQPSQFLTEFRDLMVQQIERGIE